MTKKDIAFDTLINFLKSGQNDPETKNKVYTATAIGAKTGVRIDYISYWLSVMGRIRDCGKFTLANVVGSDEYVVIFSSIREGNSRVGEEPRLA
jgi:hypothetical protein